MKSTLSPEDRGSAARWLTGYPTGTSSAFLLATAVAGVPINDVPARWRYPIDYYDLCRCLTLIALAPGVREVAFPILRANRQWAALIDRWDELVLLAESSNEPVDQWHLATDRMRELFESQPVTPAEP